jgi:HK97 family phage portal protein
MKLIDKLFRNKRAEELEIQIAKLQEDLKATSDLSKSLMGFADGNVYYWDTGKKSNFSSHFVIYRGIDMLASLGSGLPSKIYRSDTEIDPDTPLPGGFDLFNPNPFMSLNELNYIALVHFFYNGEYMVEIKEEPFFHLMPLNPRNMTRIEGTMDWKYDNGKVRRVIDSDHLIYAALFNPDVTSEGTGRGLSPVDVVKADLMNEKSAIDYNTNFFKNFGQIGGFFYDNEAKARPEDMDLIVKQFESTKVGSRNAYKTLGLPRGIRYEQLQQTMAEMQYLESRKDVRDRILAVLGIHKALFGVTDQVNRSVSEEATRMLWLHNLKPRMRRIQQVWNRQFFRRYYPTYTYKYDFSDVAELKQSVDTIDKQAKLLKFLGYTTNEINEKLNLEMEEIDDPVLNMRTIPNSLIPASELLMDDEEATASDPTELLAEYLPDEQVKETAARSNYSQVKYSRNITRLKRKSERDMAGKIGKFFSKELGDVMRIVLGKQSSAEKPLDVNTTLAEIMNKINENKAKLAITLKPLFEEASLEADKLAISMLNNSELEPLIADEVVDALVNNITNVSNYSYKLIRNQIKTGVNAGETIEEIADRVKRVYKFNSARSRTIARTETLKAVEGTTDLRYRREGVKMKQWLNTGGPESREEHNNNAAQGPIPYDQPFQNGQMTTAEGTASQVINCRCTIVPIIK